MVIKLVQVSGEMVRLEGASPGSTLRVPLPAVEVSIGHGLPMRGSRTSQMKVLDETAGEHSLRLELEGIAGSDALLHLRRNDATAQVRSEGATIAGDELHVHFPAGSGYTSQFVTFEW